MLTRIKQFFAAPVLADEFETRVAGLFNTVLLIILALTVLGTAVVIPLEPEETLSNLIFGAIICAAVLWLRRLLFQGRTRLISALLSVLLWGSITFLVYSGEGVRDPSLTGYFLVIALSGVLLGGRGAIAFGSLSLLSALSFLYAENSGLLFFTPEPVGVMDAVTLTATMGLTMLLLNFAVRSISENLQRARRNEQAQREANQQLEAIRASLEQRVAERTREFEQQSTRLQTIAEVGRLAASIHGLEELLPKIADLVSERFGFYHVGIFLLDSNDADETHAVLRAASSEGGQTMLAQGYRLRLTEAASASRAITNRAPCIASDVGEKAVSFDYSFLPHTRSELALPLVAGDQILGALDIHSAQATAFTQEDTATFQVLADQLAVAIENARLFAQSQEALEATQRAYGEIGRQAWIQMAHARSDLRYLYDSSGRVRQATGPKSPELLKASQSGQAVQDNATLAIPIMVRDQIVGAVRLCKSDTSGWSDKQIAAIKTLTEQLGIALDSARLYQDTQRRAAREQLTGEITARLRESLDIERVLQTAARELGEVSGALRVDVRLGTDED